VTIVTDFINCIGTSKLDGEPILIELLTSFSLLSPLPLPPPQGKRTVFLGPLMLKMREMAYIF